MHESHESAKASVGDEKAGEKAYTREESPHRQGGAADAVAEAKSEGERQSQDDVSAGMPADMKDMMDKLDGNQTLSRNHPLFEFLKAQKRARAAAPDAVAEGTEGAGAAAVCEEEGVVTAHVPAHVVEAGRECKASGDAESKAEVSAAGTSPPASQGGSVLPPQLLSPKAAALAMSPALLEAELAAAEEKLRVLKLAAAQAQEKAEATDGSSAGAGGAGALAAAGSCGSSTTLSAPSSSFAGGSMGSGGVPVEGYLDRIVLKFTTVSDEAEAPCFHVTSGGAQVGRAPECEVRVPSDAKLVERGHAFIEHINGCFYLRDGGSGPYAAAIRVGVGTSRRQWALEEGAAFTAGSSIFRCVGRDEEGSLMLECLAGPLDGQRRVVGRQGASFGRSSENSISVPDRELSRRHSRIEFDEKENRYYVCDVGSTNGTYVMLVGPYRRQHKLSLNDHFLVGRTGFSVNRYDYGVSEEMGMRPAMEDACAIVQHLSVPKLSRRGLAPQSYFAVYDGHGGANASAFLARQLHGAIAAGLAERAQAILAAHARRDKLPAPPLGDDAPACIPGTLVPSEQDELDAMVRDALTGAFLRTDKEFLTQSQHAHNGSTATSALLLGDRLYCSNVGDSRTVLCRAGRAIPLSCDHKPSLEAESRRIRKAGGFVINQRVMGELAVSRAFGDAEFKKGIQSILEAEGAQMNRDSTSETDWDCPLVIAEPEISVMRILPEDEFVLLACDGLFDVYSNDEVVELVRRSLRKHGDAQRVCQELTHRAINERFSRDNVSVVLVLINPKLPAHA